MDFGSRTQMDKKGGDIDLYIETNATNHEKAFDMKINFLIMLKKDIGEQKIDVVMNVTFFHKNMPIYDIARAEGIKLI